MINWLRGQWARHKAKRFFQEYPTRIDTFKLGEFGNIQFANWLNPLVLPKELGLASVRFFQKFLKEGDVALDIGANIGHMSIPMALAAGRTGQVFAFDPNPVVFKILNQNAGLNPGQANIRPCNVAVTKEESLFYYHSSEASFNNGGISPEPVSRHGKYCLPDRIKGIVLADFLASELPGGLEKIRLIKIDTEGYDMEIVKSILPVIRATRPVLISECFGRLPDEQKKDYFRLLREEGYSLTYFSDFSDAASEVPIVQAEGMLQWKHFDFYAVYRG